MKLTKTEEVTADWITSEDSKSYKKYVLNIVSYEANVCYRGPGYFDYNGNKRELLLFLTYEGDTVYESVKDIDFYNRVYTPCTSAEQIVMLKRHAEELIRRHHEKA